MSSCTDILLISSVACRIAECLDDNELALLAADLLLLSDALNAIAVRRAVCKDICEKKAANTEKNSKDSNASSGNNNSSENNSNENNSSDENNGSNDNRGTKGNKDGKGNKVGKNNKDSKSNNGNSASSGSSIKQISNENNVITPVKREQSSEMKTSGSSNMKATFTKNDNSMKMGDNKIVDMSEDINHSNKK